MSTAQDITQEPASEPIPLAVKFTGPDTIEGLAMPFGFDTDGESFTADTDFCFDWFGKSGRPFLFEHGFDSNLKGRVIGRQTDYEMLPEGVWAKVQLDRHARYRKAIDSLVEEGALGFSSGAMPHLATKNQTGHITRWPWVELSGTPIPAHPGTMVHYVKSADAIAHLEAVDMGIPDPLKAALAALDEWADSKQDGLGSELSYADDLARVLGEVEALSSRSTDRALWRVKAGRALSAANRQRLAALRDRAADVIADLDELLTSTDPAQQEAGKAALWAAVLDLEVQRARALGVLVPGVTQ